MDSSRKIISALRIIPKLGVSNVLYGLYYKAAFKKGLLKRNFPIKQFVIGSFFNACDPIRDFDLNWRKTIIEKADKIMSGHFNYFSYHEFVLGEMPNWFLNPFESVTMDNPTRHWTEIDDFSSGIGDIKAIWELSRFNWLTDLARAYRVSGEIKYLNRLNDLLKDWIINNPLNQGPNWKCGQEAAFRVMKLLSTAHILQQLTNPRKELLECVALHLERINGNIKYALIQDNNHATSETSVLYVGSTWLEKHGYNIEVFSKLKIKGRRLLEKSILKLIQPQGTFAQRSMNYHRVVLDTISFTLHMMNELNEYVFSEKVRERLLHLGMWQYKMTLGSQGETPNFGSNDGAMIENLHSLNYTDYRASTQLFFISLVGERIYDLHKINEPAFWRYGNDINNLPIFSVEVPPYELFDQQILILRNKNASLFMKLPEDTFRPGNDAFHIDLWINGKNILMDTGTYSYNSGEWTEYFKSVRMHNTVQFGNKEQMPKISRFLNGDWLKLDKGGVIDAHDHSISWKGSYTDYRNNIHQREIHLWKDKLTIKDLVASDSLAYANFHVSSISSDFRFDFISDIEHVDAFGYHSQYYLHKDNIKVLTFSFNSELNVEFNWSQN